MNALALLTVAEASIVVGRNLDLVSTGTVRSKGRVLTAFFTDRGEAFTSSVAAARPGPAARLSIPRVRAKDKRMSFSRWHRLAVDLSRSGGVFRSLRADGKGA